MGQRSATSMARRLQDPLAELVKIEPKAIGVGQSAWHESKETGKCTWKCCGRLC